MTGFGERLLDKIAQRGRLCAGIDPHPSLLSDWGLSDDASSLEKFALTATEALAPEVAVVKPQSAFFERHGAAGISVLERTITTAQAAGALVLLDVKRGDIGSTVAAYADAYLADRGPLASDAITVSPYLGYGSLRPFLDAAADSGRGVFVLALTSNPEGGLVQRAVDADGRLVAQQIVDAAAEDNAGAQPLGNVGLVVGATVGELDVDLSRLNGPVLVPGFGAQGGTVDDVRRLFGDLPGVVASSSRGLLSAGPDAAALRDAVRRTNDELS